MLVREASRVPASVDSARNRISPQINTVKKEVKQIVSAARLVQCQCFPHPGKIRWKRVRGLTSRPITMWGDTDRDAVEAEAATDEL